MTKYDYFVIGFYMVFMFSLGPIYKSFSKTASDFFRGGGGMLWWVVGSSAFMTTFSAWSFTGGAAKAYETGTFFLLLFASNAVALVFCYFFAAHKFRQMRVVTAVEGIRKRYGTVSEQVYTWLPILTYCFLGGVFLYTISVFMAGVFEVDMTLIIIVLGVVMIGMTLLGGSWAATAGDFVQMLMVLMITVMMAVLTLRHDQIGGFRGLIDKMPSCHFRWTEFSRPWVIIIFAVTLLVNQITMLNSMLTGAARYVFVKDGRDARKAVLVSLAGFVFLSPIWMIPAVGAAVIFPDLSGRFSQLNNPNEAAYVAIAVELLPTGLLGLLVCGIFAASLTSMNSLLNLYSGIFVRNFYIRIINRNASELKQILVGRVFILIYGVIWIVIAMFFRNIKGLELFDLLLLAIASVGLPTALPLTYGLFFKKTPEWTGWSTMVAGFIPAVILGLLFKVEPFVRWLWQDPNMTTNDVVKMIWRADDLNPREIGDLKIAITTGTIFLVCNLWFFSSMLFYKGSSPAYRKRVDEFFTEMDTPIDRSTEHEPDYEGDSRQYGVLGNLCLVYGLFILLLLAIPNDFHSRILILICGGLVVMIGAVLRVAKNKTATKFDRGYK